MSFTGLTLFPLHYVFIFYANYIYYLTFLIFKGEHPAAMQHGGQLKLEYPLSAVLISVFLSVFGP